LARLKTVLHYPVFVPLHAAAPHQRRTVF
jgi:hypothetical protein